MLNALSSQFCSHLLHWHPWNPFAERKTALMRRKADNLFQSSSLALPRSTTVPKCPLFPQNFLSISSYIFLMAFKSEQSAGLLLTATFQLSSVTLSVQTDDRTNCVVEQSSFAKCPGGKCHQVCTSHPAVLQVLTSRILYEDGNSSVMNISQQHDGTLIQRRGRTCWLAFRMVYD